MRVRILTGACALAAALVVTAVTANGGARLAYLLLHPEEAVAEQEVRKDAEEAVRKAAEDAAERAARPPVAPAVPGCRAAGRPGCRAAGRPSPVISVCVRSLLIDEH